MVIPAYEVMFYNDGRVSYRGGMHSMRSPVRASVPAGVELMSDPGQTLVHVVAPRVEEEPEAEEGIEPVEGEEPAEGAPAADAAAPAEESSGD